MWTEFQGTTQCVCSHSSGDHVAPYTGARQTSELKIWGTTNGTPDLQSWKCIRWGVIKNNRLKHKQNKRIKNKGICQVNEHDNNWVFADTSGIQIQIKMSGTATRTSPKTHVRALWQSKGRYVIWGRDQERSWAAPHVSPRHGNGFSSVEC